MGIEELPANKATPDEIKEAQRRVAINNPEHLKQWMQKTRPFIVFESSDLLKALEPLWPEGATSLQNIVNVYRAYRMQQLSGEVREVKDPITKQTIQQGVYKSDALTEVELDRCIRHFVGQILEHNPNWKLEDAPL